MTERMAAMRPPTILVANDQEWFARSLESVLRATGYSVLRAQTGREALELARAGHPDALIIHQQLVDLAGIELCRRLSRDPSFSPTTPLLLTANAPFGHDQRIAALEAGAWDVSIHPIEADALLFKLGTYLRAKREHDRLREGTYIDEITGLYNRHGLARRAQEIAAAARRARKPVTCVAFAPAPEVLVMKSEVDEQSSVHVARQLGAVCQLIGRSSDAIGRIAGTEFGVIAPETAAEGAVRLAERYRDAIVELPFSTDGGQRGLVMRAGYVTVEGDEDVPIEGQELLSRATAALRRALAARQGGVFILPWDGGSLSSD